MRSDDGSKRHGVQHEPCGQYTSMPHLSFDVCRRRKPDTSLHARSTHSASAVSIVSICQGFQFLVGLTESALALPARRGRRDKPGCYAAKLRHYTDFLEHSPKPKFASKNPRYIDSIVLMY